MWNSLTERYYISQVEIAQPLEAIVAPEGYTGIAAVLRLHGNPVGFFMQSGARIDADELAAAILEHAGKQILSEKLYASLRGSVESSVFTSPDLAMDLTMDIAICTHGRPDALARCLGSLQAIGLPCEKIGVLIIDNAPQDQRTALAVTEYPGVRYILEPKPGLDFARNRALVESSAELLAFIDDDVVVDRCWLRGLARSLGHQSRCRSIYRSYPAAGTGNNCASRL